MGVTGISTVTLPSSAEFSLAAKDGQMYKIQASWPMEWRSRQGHEHVAVPYAVDGNAMFLTAAEAAWRRATGPHYKGGCVVVSIGYPLKGAVFSPRRNYDLTPPSPSAPVGFGGAEHFLDFVQYTLKPLRGKSF
ncbi:siderophore esterase IroE-like protein [Metarhizium acridum CQMa 102]|uniref:Siderophore esterase IroE-like protein n=1 Tax=Metarhizium acridum (strain CQMa 102) TaxID=655827 RepID=E9E790_METAQ|nr:siderophore esterase IroE-like protein [Metarhizium acridum CQMa 102]EFY88265.1 siderophore esterase IroE-like protein [Metarhizium acridum CQMa 102]